MDAATPVGGGPDDVGDPERTAASAERPAGDTPTGAGSDAAPETDIQELDRERDALLYVLADVNTLPPDGAVRTSALFSRYAARLTLVLEERETRLRHSAAEMAARAGATGTPPAFAPTHLVGAARQPVQLAAVVGPWAFVVNVDGRAGCVYANALVPVALPAAPPPPPSPAWAPPAPSETPQPAPTPPARLYVPPPQPAERAGPTAGQALVNGLRHLGDLVASQVAIDGLAYLGVLLTFTGTLGYVLVAYNSVSNPWLRTCAPLVMPLALAGASIRLRRRGSLFMSSVLEFLSAALLPVILSGSIGTLMPSAAGVAVRTLMAVALAAVYAGLAGQRASSPLRFAVVPMLWVAVWTATLMLHGNAYSADQVAATASFILLTVAATRAAPWLPFAEATRVAAVVGTGVVMVLAVLFAATEGGPAASILVIGAAAMTTTELVAWPTTRALPLSLLQSGVLAVSIGCVVAPLGPGAAGLAAVLGAAALLVWQELSRPHAPALVAPLVLLLTGLLLTTGDPWPELVAAGLLSAAAHTWWLGLWRQRSALERPPGEAVAAVSLLTATLFAHAAWRALPPGSALVLLASLVTVLAAAGRLLRTRDVLYIGWTACAALAIVAATPAARGTAGDVELAVAAALAAATLAWTPFSIAVRTWSSGAVLAWASVLLFDGVGLAVTARPVAWAAAALAAIVVASVMRGPVAGHLTVAGHVGGAIALALAAPGVTTVVALGAWTGGWGWTVVNAEIRGSPLADALPRVLHPQRVVAAAPVTFLAGCVPALLIQVLDLAGVSTSHRTWVGIALVVTALAYAAVVQRVPRRQPLAGITATAAVVLSMIAVAVSAPDLNTSIATVAGSVAVVAVMGEAVRRPFMTWFAWTMGVTLVLLLASRAGVEAGSLHSVLTVTGAVLLLGALLLDERLPGGDGSEGMLRHGWAMQPTALGALALPVGLALGFHDAPSAYGWWTLGGAAVYLGAALLLRTGAVSGITWGLASFGVGALLPVDVVDRPSLLVPFSAVLVAVAVPLSRASEPRDPWLRWDLPPLVVAHVVVAVALTRALAVDAVPVTWAASAGVAMLIVVRWRHWAWPAGAAALLLVAGAVAGHGWFALALGLVSTGGALAATRTTGVVRAALQGASALAAAAAWAEALVWSARATGEEAAATALMSAGVALVLAVLLRRGRVRIDWAWTWGTTAMAGVAIPALASASIVDAARVGHLGTAGGLAVLTLAASLADRPLGRRELRWVGAVSAGGAAVAALAASEWAADQQLAAGALMAAGLALVIAALLRVRRLQRPWAIPWAALAAAGMAAVAVVASTSAVVAAAGYEPAVTVGATWALAIAGALAVFAVACGLATRPLRQEEALTWACAGAATWAWGEVLAGSGWSAPRVITATALLSGTVLVVGALVLRVGRLPRIWVSPLAVPSATALVVSALGGWMATATAQPDARVTALGVGVGMLLMATAAILAARELQRRGLTWAACGAAGWSWVALMSAAEWSLVDAAGTTAIIAGALALAAAVLVRRRVLTTAWAVPVASLAGLGVVTGSGLVFQQTLGGSHHPWSLAAAGGIGLLAAAAAAAAEPLGRRLLRDACAVIAFAALATVAYDVEPGLEQAVTMAVAASLVSLAGALGLWSMRPDSRWNIPLGELAGLAAVTALAVAPAAWPARGPLVIATLVTATEAGWAGVVLRRPEPLYVSPVLACTAWFLFATASLGPEPNWLTSAIGVALLAIVEIARWDQNRTLRPGGHTLLGEALLTLDYVGMAFLVGASLVETVVSSPWFGLLGVGLGVTLGAWAVLTHVRHRLEFGAAVVVLSLLLLLVTPLTSLAPQLHGFGFWGVLTGIGVALLVIAALVEQGRGRVIEEIHHFQNLTKGWR